MRDFNKVLNETIEGDLPPEPGFQGGNLIQNAFQILDELQQAKAQLDEINAKLNSLTERINASLAAEIRQLQPKLPINLADGCCSVGYRSSNLSVRPDLNSKRWVIDTGSRFGRRFARENGHLVGMDSVQPLAKAIVSYFGNRYRSL